MSRTSLSVLVGMMAALCGLLALTSCGDDGSSTPNGLGAGGMHSGAGGTGGSGVTHWNFYELNNDGQWKPWTFIPRLPLGFSTAYTGSSGNPAFAAVGKTLYEFYISGGEWVDRERDAPGAVTAIFSDGSKIAVGARLYEWDWGSKAWASSDYSDAPGAVAAFHDDKHWIAVGKKVYAWDSSAKDWIIAFGDAPGDVRGFAYSPGPGQVIAVGRSLYHWSSNAWSKVDCDDAPAEIISMMPGPLIVIDW